MFCCCDRLWGELTLGSMIFESVFHPHPRLPDSLLAPLLQGTEVLNLPLAEKFSLQRPLLICCVLFPSEILAGNN